MDVYNVLGGVPCNWSIAYQFYHSLDNVGGTATDMSPFFQFIHPVESDICVKRIVLMYEHTASYTANFLCCGTIVSKYNY
jgi:hypothetical protein